jgi:hypothetical protein
MGARKSDLNENPLAKQLYYLLKASSSSLDDFDRFNFAEAVKEKFCSSKNRGREHKNKNYGTINLNFMKIQFFFYAVYRLLKLWMTVGGQKGS